MDSPLHNKSQVIFDLDALVKLKLPYEIFRQKIKTKLSTLDSDLVDKYLKAKDVRNLMNEAVRLYGQAAKEKIFPWTEQFEKDYFENAHYNEELWKFINEEGGNRNFYIWTNKMGKTVKRLLSKEKRFSHFQKIISREDVDLPLPYSDGFFKIFDLNKHRRYDFLLVSDKVEFAQTAHELGIEFLLITKHGRNKTVKN